MNYQTLLREMSSPTLKCYPTNSNWTMILRCRDFDSLMDRLLDRQVISIHINKLFLGKASSPISRSLEIRLYYGYKVRVRPNLFHLFPFSWTSIDTSTACKSMGFGDGGQLCFVSFSFGVHIVPPQPSQSPRTVIVFALLHGVFALAAKPLDSPFHRYYRSDE